MIKRTLLIAAATLALTAPFLSADVTIKTAARNSGYKGTGANTGSSAHMVQGIKSRDDNDFKFTGKVMNFFAGGKKSGANIVRVDLDKIWNLNTKKKTYTEMSISQWAAQMKSGAHAEEGPGGPEDKPTHRVKKSDVTVKKTGVKKTINGFNTEETQLRLQVDVEEIASGEVTTYIMINSFWFTPWTGELKRAMDEEVKFAKAYIAKLGFSVTPEDRDMYGVALINMMLGIGDAKTAGLISQLKEKSKGLNGYAIVTATDWYVQEDDKAVQRKREEKAKADAADKPETPSLNDSPTDAATKLFGGFAKKKYKEHEEAKAKKQEGKPVMSTYHEVVSVSLDPVNAATFDLPAGFKRVEK